MFDEPPKPVYEKQPVGQPSQRIGYLSLGDVGLRACHSQGFSRIVEYREPPIQHPPKCSVFVEHPVLALEVRRRAIAMGGYLFFHSFSIGVMNPVEPFLRTVADFIFVPAQHGFPSRRVIHVSRLNIPIPKTIIGPARRQSVPFFTLSQCFLRSLVRQLSSDAGKRHRKVHWFRQIIVCSQIQGLDDVFALTLRRHHNDREINGRMAFAQSFQRIKAADLRHLDIEKYQVHGVLFDALHELLCTFHDVNQIATARQPAGKHIPVHFVVIHN